MSLLLGAFLFEDFEIPEKLNFGGKQMLAVHKLIGGGRVIDAMGPDPDEIKWSGRFQGGHVVVRAKLLEAMRNAGRPVILVNDLIVKTVLVSEFSYDYERSYQATYTISCTVLPNALDDLAQTLDDLVGAALASVTSLLNGAVSGATSSTFS